MTDWEAEYEFWQKLIQSEVERLRFNRGYEPLEVELYPTGTRSPVLPDYVGRTRIGRQSFRALGFWCFNALGKEVLKVRIFPEPT
jgi:hypothetical protein